MLWLAAVAIEGLTVYLTSRGGRWQLPSAEHYAERHGLVVILALGESIISIGFAASRSPLTPDVVLASVVAVSVALGMWWIYFERVSDRAGRSIGALVGDRRTSVATAGTYLHFGIVAGILLVSLGLGAAIEQVGAGNGPSTFSLLTLCAGAAIFLASTATYSLATRTPKP